MKSHVGKISFGLGLCAAIVMLAFVSAPAIAQPGLAIDGSLITGKDPWD
jgi:hypothetical protein